MQEKSQFVRDTFASISPHQKLPIARDSCCYSCFKH
jgi:hypothetical protein